VFESTIAGRRLHNRLKGIDQFRPRAVVQRQGHDHPRVLRRLLRCPGHSLLHLWRQFVDPPDVTKLDVVLIHQRNFVFQIGAQQRHQEAGFSLGTLPIFRRKRI
jgi:hypothetical protein